MTCIVRVILIDADIVQISHDDKYNMHIIPIIIHPIGSEYHSSQESKYFH